MMLKGVPTFLRRYHPDQVPRVRASMHVSALKKAPPVVVELFSFVFTITHILPPQTQVHKNATKSSIIVEILKIRLVKYYACVQLAKLPNYDIVILKTEYFLPLGVSIE